MIDADTGAIDTDARVIDRDMHASREPRVPGGAHGDDPQVVVAAGRRPAWSHALAGPLSFHGLAPCRTELLREPSPGSSDTLQMHCM